jgi:hypothetical protein
MGVQYCRLVLFRLKGAYDVFCSCWIGGWWRKSKSLWVSPWLPFLLETSKIIFLGLLQVFFLPNANGDRRFLWDELAGLLSWWDLPWCMEGDFNVTCFPSENLGEAHFCLAMFELLDFISELSSWTFLLWAALLRGLAIGILSCGLELELVPICNVINVEVLASICVAVYLLCL